MEGIRIFKKRFHFLILQYVGEFSIKTPAQKSHFGQKSTPKVVQPYTSFCVGLTKTCVGVSETWPPYTSSRIALTEFGMSILQYNRSAFERQVKEAVNIQTERKYHKSTC